MRPDDTRGCRRYVRDGVILCKAHPFDLAACRDDRGRTVAARSSVAPTGGRTLRPHRKGAAGSLLHRAKARLVWDKRRSGVTNTQADVEMAWTNLGGPARIFRLPWMGADRATERGDFYHPTQKPIALMRWIVARVPDGIVLDPYMGAGSTLIAAKEAGRHAIGVEIEERYCEIAARRCAQEVLGLVPA